MLKLFCLLVVLQITITTQADPTANFTFNATKTRTFSFEMINNTTMQNAKFMDLSLKLSNYCENYYGFEVQFDLDFGMDYPINAVNFELCFHVMSDSPNAYKKPFYVTDLLYDKNYTWPTNSSEDLTPGLSPATLFGSEHGFTMMMTGNSSETNVTKHVVCIAGNEFQNFFKETENKKTLGVTILMGELVDGTCVHQGDGAFDMLQFCDTDPMSSCHDPPPQILFKKNATSCTIEHCTSCKPGK